MLHQISVSSDLYTDASIIIAICCAIIGHIVIKSEAILRSTTLEPPKQPILQKRD